MNEKALRVLEYDKITRKLQDKAVSPMGKLAAESLKPMESLEDIERAQKETSEAQALILQKGTLPLGGISDIRDSLKRAVMGGSLSIDELLKVGDFVYVCSKALGYHKGAHLSSVPTSARQFPILDPLFSGIEAPVSLEKEITRCIASSEDLNDDASPKLSEIRRGIKRANERVRESLNTVIHSASYKNMLQDSVVTIRNDRFCVPVKQEYRSSFPGMQHDQSSTGATVFMEPMSVVSLNNKIKELKADEREEINAILRKLSGLVAEEGEVLENNSVLLEALDLAFAKGELSISMNGIEPQYNSEGRINIKKGRHPLLDKKTVVPTDISLGKDFSILLITGPNTGGKTVALKTIGLFCLMGQAGLHIPAFDQSELAVFDEVFADIGDEQSIEQSLSTFSSHMRNIVEILQSLTPSSLVLLDELGAGTDPVEGAALAVAILEHLRVQGARTAITTHYSELKVYALATEGAENASCEFDVETLQPTFRLLTGIPGKSNAFAISRRLGLPESVIKHAGDILDSEDIRFENVITDLEISKKTVILEQERAEDYRRQAESLKLDLESQQKKLSAQREKIMQEAREEARKAIHEARDEAGRLLKDYQKSLKENQLKEAELIRQEIRIKADAMDEATETVSHASLKPAPKHLKNGDRVFVKSIGQPGSVISAPDASGEATIQAGLLKVRAKLSDLFLDETAAKPKADMRAARPSFSKNATISNEIDLRGMTVDEGTSKADKFLDDAFLGSLPQVTIIHGKGTGALRAAIQSMLKGRLHIKSYRFGKYGEGEDGVTIVALDL
ncbi:MAG: endonuclease MutS2 [Clostridiales bacterium]|nr:endonuclease MutS2 [Clostridiales bacterium]